MKFSHRLLFRAYSHFFKMGIAFCLFVFLEIFISSSYADDFQIFENKNVKMVFPPKLTSVSLKTVELVPEIGSDLERTFSWSFYLKPTVVLMNNPERFRRIVSSPLVVGFAVPQKHLVIIDYTKILNNLKLYEILKHELCHLLLHEHLNQVFIPRWFDEGIAQWVSGGVMDILHDQKNALLPKAAFSDHLIPLGALNEGFPENSNGLRLAYEESKNFIDYLINSHGKKKFFEILHLMKEGTPLRKAFFEALGAPLYKIEKEWLASLKSNINWFAYMSYYLYEILFALGGLILFYAFIKLWRKKRTYMEEE